jgi:type II secretory pathway pseudopilin PulG
MIAKLSIVAGTRPTRGAFTQRQHSRFSGFTLAEVLVSLLVLVLLVIMVTQLVTSATAVTRVAHKQIDTDTQARLVFDRMALDFGQMIKRTDIDYYVKQPDIAYRGHGNGHGWGRGRTGDLGSDQIAFFSQVPGYYPSAWGSPISVVAYRVNEDTSANNASYVRLERYAKGLVWNGVSSTNIPMVFLPLTIDSNWPAATHNFGPGNPNLSRDPDYYETIAPGVFRFEYYYLLKDGRVTDWPWDRWDDQFANQQTITNPIRIGLNQVESIAVSIAVIDPAGRALIDAVSPDRILDLAEDMADFKNARGRGVGAQKIGDLEYQWKTVIESVAQTGLTPSGLPVPPEAAKMIRVYNRYFDLKSL